MGGISWLGFTSSARYRMLMEREVVPIAPQKYRNRFSTNGEYTPRWCCGEAGFWWREWDSESYGTLEIGKLLKTRFALFGQFAPLTVWRDKIGYRVAVSTFTLLRLWYTDYFAGSFARGNKCVSPGLSAKSRAAFIRDSIKVGDAPRTF